MIITTTSYFPDWIPIFDLVHGLRRDHLSAVRPLWLRLQVHAKAHFLLTGTIIISIDEEDEDIFRCEIRCFMKFKSPSNWQELSNCQITSNGNLSNFPPSFCRPIILTYFDGDLDNYWWMMVMIMRAIMTVSPSANVTNRTALWDHWLRPVAVLCFQKIWSTSTILPRLFPGLKGLSIHEC